MRIPYTPNTPPPNTPAEDLEIRARIAARRSPRPLQPLDLALLHSPPVADGWNSFLGAIRTRTTALSPALREIAICRVAVCNEAWYEWGHHAPLARAAGVGEKGMKVVGRRGVLEDVEGEEEGEEEARRELDGDGDGGEGKGKGKGWAVLRLADEMTRNVKVRDELFDEVKGVLSDREIVEVVATVSQSCFIIFQFSFSFSYFGFFSSFFFFQFSLFFTGRFARFRFLGAGGRKRESEV
ncbi:AhpD-like protein [Xylariomycetidae sp. FL2044]|nr:AhpD-like protein [Xylariomycetidae sp. FL2044]